MYRAGVLVVDILENVIYNIGRYGTTCRMAFKDKEMPKKLSKGAVLYENTKIIGGLIVALTVVIGIALNVFTLPQRVTVVETKVAQSETRLTVLEEKLNALIQDNKEIKADLKELLRAKNH